MGTFWDNYLKSASQSLDLVLDKTRTQESTAAQREDVLLASLPQELEHVEGTPAGIVLLSAFHAYVSRISSQEELTLGVQPSLLLQQSGAINQQQVPLVPLRCPPVSPQDTICSHAQQTKQQLQQLLPHSQMSLQDICSAAGIQPASSMQHPLFQAGVVVASSCTAAAMAAAGLDLTLVLVPSNGSSKAASQVHLLYNSGLFTKEGAQLMARHFQVYLREVLAGAGNGSGPQPLLTAPLMDQAEQQLVLKGFNATDLEYDRQAFVHTLFMQRAKKTPAAPCVVFGDTVFSYAEIDAASNRIANYLIEEAGVTPDSMVAVLLLRSPLMIATLLGVLKAGAGYLPLDHHHPEGRIAFMLEDAAVKAVVVQPDLVNKLPDSAGLSSRNIHTLLLHPEARFNTKGPQQAPARGAAFPPVVSATLAPASFGAAATASPDWTRGQLGTPSTTCYIIYTSGSTGKPKGVVVMHQGLTAYIAWFRAFFGITASDVFLQKTPTNFDASMDELWPSLTAGAELVVAPPEAHRDVHSVMMLITRHCVTTSSAVPSQLQALAREILSLHGPEAAAAGQAPCSSLKQVLSGGEALTTTMAQDISAAMPRCRLFNTYGPTETTVGITAWQCDASEAQHGADGSPVAATIPIGNGIYNARLYVVDADLKPVPIGVPGELYISGVQVAWGYLNRPDLNEKTFVPNPFCEGPGTFTDRMYKAGDLVRWLPGRHACLEFLGRVDHQVKLRGFRIELQEIEAALGALPGVSQVATALAKNPTTNQDQLVAWVSPASLDAQDLVQQLHGMLPEYMIPTVVVRMDQLPLLPSEKVNRKALPAPDFTRDAVKPPVKAPAKPAAATPAAAADAARASSRSSRGELSDSSSSPMASRSSSPSPRMDPLMRFISEVWADVLGISSDSIGQLSDFFALGGNSLLCGRMNSSIRSGLSVPGLSGMLIYQNPSLAEFSQAVAVAGAVLPPGYAAASGSSSPASYSSLGEELDSPSRLSSDLSDLQQYIAEAWAEALGTDASALGPDDDFFARGGNSLLCGRMNSSIRSGLSIPSMSGMLIYQHPTLGAFTEAVAATGATLPTSYRLSSSVSSPQFLRSPSSYDAIDTIMEVDALQDFIAAAWAETLGVEGSSLSADSDFFALGGNSLLCGKMNSRLRVGLNLPGLSGMLIYQNTTLEAFTEAIAQAGPSLPCDGSTCSGGSRLLRRPSFDGSTISNSSSFRIAAPAGAGAFSTASSTVSRWGPSGYSSFTSSKSPQQKGIVSSTASAAAQAAAAAFVQDHPAAAAGGTLYEQSFSAASKAAYAAANAAFNTVMSSLGLDATSYDADSSKAATNSLGPKGSGIFNSYFRAGAGAAGGSAIPVYDAHMQSLPSFGYPAEAGKGSLKPALLKGLPQEEHVAPADQVKPSVALCTVLQILGVAFISGAAHALTVVPMLAWMWLLAAYGFPAIAALPALNMAAMVVGLLFTIMGKWVFIGRYKEGKHPIWGSYYRRHWLSHQFIVGARSSFLPLIKRTTLVNWFYRALGMKIGKNVLIDSDDFLGYDLLEVKDNAVLDMYCGVTAVTFEAGKPHDKFPTGKMTIKRASIGAGAVVGAHGMVVCADVPDGGVVQPCTASNNPSAAWKGTRWPQTGPEAVVAAKSQDKPLGALSGLLALIITDEVLAIVSYPLIIGLLLFWCWLSGYDRHELPVAAADTFQCMMRMPGTPFSPEAADKCINLMRSGIKSMLLYPPALFILGQLLVLLVIPYKWLVRGRVQPDDSLSLTPDPKSWSERFRSHLMQVMLDHPALKVYLYMWTGTAMFNAWLRAMGTKVGKQAWIGEGLQLFEHDLVEIGDCVSVCSEVSLMPSTVMGSRKIIIKGGSDVTNQTCVYPGVTVMPGACLGVFTYAEAERTFPRNSIVQGPMVLMPGQPEPEEGGPPVDTEPAVTRAVSSWQYFNFNALYTSLMMVLLPVSAQLCTTPFYLATTVVVFKCGILFGALLVPGTWVFELAMEILWMALVKRVLLKRCQGNNPFYHYTHTAWMITGILYYFHQIGLMKYLSGSQLAVWYYRTMGAKVGKGVLLNSLASNEPDCLTIGDGTVIDDLSFVMAHTVENRCVKFHDVVIGSRVTIGCGSAVMPGCVVHDEAVIGDVSIVMKGETVPAGALWRGVPAVPVLDQA